jgi:hypothetical protein
LTKENGVKKTIKPIQDAPKNNKHNKVLVIPPSVGKFIKTSDTIRMSPRDFLRIGKVQKEQEEPMTEAQIKHRDRSYIINKLNRSIQ